MKKLLVMMLMVLGLSVGGFAKGNTFTKGNTEPRLSNEHFLYLGLIDQLTRECARMDRTTYIECTELLTKYEEHFLEVRGLGDGYFLSNLKDDDLAYIYQVLSGFVTGKFNNLNRNLSEYTEEEKATAAAFSEQWDICGMTSHVDKKFVGCK